MIYIYWKDLIHVVCPFSRDANINIQKIGRIQTKTGEVFKTTCNFNGTKLAKNRDVDRFGCQNGQKCYEKNMKPPYQIGRVGISTSWED